MGEVSTCAGLAGTSGISNGTGAVARFNAPFGLAVDASEDIFVADSGNHAIRKISPAGEVSTLAGLGGLVGSVDGTGTSVGFYHPESVAVDVAGNIYVADSYNNKIRVGAPAKAFPLVTKEPVSLTVRNGSRAVLSVTATGGGLSYQWRKNGVNIAGATFASHTIPNALFADSDFYDVLVSNEVYRISSLPAQLVVACASTSNVTFSQRSDGSQMVDVYYTLEGSAPRVLVMASIDGGTTFSYIGAMSGEEVNTISAGTSVKHFVWSAGSQYANSGSAKMQMRVVAPDGVGGMFNPIFAGTYSIGNLVGDSDIQNANPVSVRLGGYYIATNDTTKAQWDTVRMWAEGNGYADLAVGQGKERNHPVQTVSWYDAVKWANAASERDSLTPCYRVGGSVLRTGTSDAVTCDWTANGYRLPTEAEWEVAARGGLNGKRFPWGDTISQSQANYLSDPSYAYDLSGAINDFHPTYKIYPWPYTSPVGSFASNFYGLYDMAGNVSQWCWDRYATQYSGGSDPRGAITGVNRTVRGGSWVNFWGLRTAHRLSSPPTDVSFAIGFRLVRGSGTGTLSSLGTLDTMPPVLTVTGTGAIATSGMGAVVELTTARATDNLGPVSIAYSPLSGSLFPIGSTTVTATATDSMGNVAIGTFTVTVNLPPSITSQPLSQSTLSGSPVTLSVTAEGTSPLLYQWRKDGVNIGAGTASSYSIPSALPANAGVYSVLVTNGYGSVTSGTATLTVNSPVNIASQPASVSITTGSSATLSVNATGTAPITYQWRKDGVYIAGQTGSSLAIANAQPADAGSYSVVVSNVVGSLSSADAAVMVNTPVILSAHPASLTVTTGSSATLSVIASGTTPLNYQWQKGGVNIPGATSAVYTVAAAQLADAGVYSVVVTNPAGSVTSNSAVLNVNVLGAPTYTWSTFAGPLGGFGSSDGVGIAARFYNPSGVVMDGSGTLYVADKDNHVIRKITSNGEVTTFAGAPGVPGSTDGLGSAARFSQPVGIALDGAGNLYVSDSSSNLIRKITSAGSVSTIAGLANYSGSADGTGSAARFKGPAGLAVDSGGNVYVADGNNHTIRKITSGGVVSTFAGTALSSGSLDATGSAARFNGPNGLAVDASGNVYVGDSVNHVIRKITSGGVVSTLAGTAGAGGSADGTGAAAQFYNPLGLAVDSLGNVYVCDSNNKIRKVTAAGVVTTLSGSGLLGSVDGAAGVARFNSPYGVTLDPAGNLFIAETGNDIIRKVTSAGDVSTFAGATAPSGNTVGTRYLARFNEPTGVAVDGFGNVYVADRINNKVRKILPGGVATNFAGSGTTGSLDGAGTGAQFTYPCDLALDASGNIYVADTSNQLIRKITSAGVVTTLAGSAGLSGSTDGTGSGARFNGPQGVAVDGAGNVYVGDTGNHVIRKITSAGVVTTLAGSAGVTGSTDATGSAALFNHPTGVAVDSSGNVYVADTTNAVIRKITSGGVVSTFAGSAGMAGVVDGTGSAARFRCPTGVAVDASGTVYVSESFGGYVIRKISSGGVVSTIGGADYMIGCDDGVGTNARFMGPARIAVDGAGNLYVGDSMNNKLRFGASSAAPPVLYAPPDSLTVMQGGSASLSVTAAGSLPISYQWRLNGYPVAGGTLSTLTIGSVQASDGGVYDVLMFNSGGMTTSLSGTLTVNSPPSILSQPANLSVITGSSATLSVTAAGTAPLAYQWTKSGVSIVGGTASSYAIPSAQISDADNYNVFVTNAFGSVTSGTATLTVTTPVTITSQPASVSVIPGASPVLSVGAAGTAPISYQWLKNGVPISGATASTYTLSNVQLLDSGAAYSVVVGNPVGSATSATATLSVSLPVVIMSQPSGRTVSVGASTMFSVSATGSVPFTYQWQKGGVDIAGATGATYTIASAQLGDGGAYSVRVTNPAGSVFSNTAPLGVNIPGAPTYTWFTLAGPEGGYGANDGPAGEARFYNPVGVAMDGGGNVYVADTSNHVIRKITMDGVVSTLAGLAGASGTVDGTGSVARFKTPSGIVLDGAGNVYVADTGNHTIRRITAGGVVSTLAGAAGSSGAADGTGGSAFFNTPYGLALDVGGDLVVADSGNHAVRRVTSGGVVSTLAGTLGVSGSVNGTGTAASFNGLYGVAIDGSGNVYVADRGNHLIRKITSGGVVSTLAGAAGVSGSINGTGMSARFKFPAGVAVDAGGNVYVVEGNHVIRKITGGGAVSTLAGGVGESGTVDGPGGAARFYNPGGIAADGAGNLIVTDSGNHTIRKLTGVGVVSTLAGLAGGSGSANGVRSAARFTYPAGVAVDGAGVVYVADTNNHAIRAVSASGVVSTSAGSLGTVGSTDGAGGLARFKNPSGVALDAAGNLYVADAGNHLIRKMTVAGSVSTLAGTALVSGSVDGTGAAALFNSPNGVTVDLSGNVYVADTTSQLIRKVTSVGVVSTLAGMGGVAASMNGTGSAARFNNPYGVAVDASGNVFVGDMWSRVIRKVTGGGLVTTLAGANGVGGAVDGVGTVARFYNPGGVAVDSLGNIYVADPGNHAIRKLSSSGTVSTIGGLAGYYGCIEGTGIEARFNSPKSVAVDATGNLYVADVNNHKIRFGASSTAPPVLFAPPESLTVLQGGSASLSVSAVGSPPISYQWRLNGELIPGATSSTLTIGSVQAADAGTYDVLVSSSGGMTTSPAGTLTVNSPPSILTDPGSLAVTAGSSATLSVTAAGTAPLSYQWQKDGALIAGGTASTYAIPVVSAADVGAYNVTVMNAFGSVTSGSAMLTLNIPVTITSQPGSLKLNTGSSGTLSVSATGTPPITYQWRKDGTAIPGANEASLALVNAGALDSGIYDVVVGNAAGSVTSFYATVGVFSAVSIVNQPTDGNAVLGGSWTFGVAASGTAPIGYQWRKDGVPILAGSESASVSTVSGGTWGYANGPSSGARFDWPAQLASDSAGNIYVADSRNHNVRILSAGSVSTLAGLGSGYQNGALGSAKFNDPEGIAVDRQNNVYVSDSGNHVIRKISGGMVTTLAGSPGVTGTADGQGNAARFNGPQAIAIDSTGNLFVADRYNATIRRVTPSGNVTTFAGLGGVAGSANGVGSAARFNGPIGIAIDGAENLYVVELGNHSVRKITPDGTVTTFAGVAGSTGTSDGVGTVARFQNPQAITVDPYGYLYVTDTDAHTIRRISPSGVVKTIAGSPMVSGMVDGHGGAARFNGPRGLVFGPGGNLYVSELINCAIRSIELDPLTSGAGPSLAIANAQPVSAGNYDVVVWNPVSSVVSGTAALGVYSPVSITSSPVGGRFASGATVTLVAAASGGGPLSYQWRKDGEPISGGTSDSLVLPSLTHRSAGVYDVVVSNPASSAISAPALVTANLSSIRGATTNLTFDLPPSLSAGLVTTVQVFSHPAGASSLPLLSHSVVSNGTVTVNLRNLTASGDYFVRFTQIGLDGQSVSAETVPFGLAVHSWAEGAGSYEALLESGYGQSPDGAAYRGVVLATVTSTGAVSGRVQYVEAAPLLDEAGQSTGLRAYSPVTRSFSGALAPKDGEPLTAVFSTQLGSGSDSGRQAISLQVDYSSTPARLAAEVRDSVSANPSVWTSATAPTLATPMRLGAAVTASGTLDFSDLTGLFNLASDRDSVDVKNTGYVLAQVGKSGRVVWRTRFLGRNGSGSGMLNVDDPESPAVTLYQWSAVQPAGLFHSSAFMGRLNFERVGEGVWKMNAGSSLIGANLERQGTYARRVAAGGGTQTVYSEGLGAAGWNGTGLVGFETLEGVRWGSGASNPPPYEITRDSNGQVFRSFNMLSVMPDFFKGSGTSRAMRLTLEDPEADGLGIRPLFAWNVTVSMGGQLRAEPVQSSGAPALSLKLDLWYGEISGVYVRNGVRRSLYGTAVPSQTDALQTGRGWIEKGIVPSVQRGDWILKGNP